MGYEDLIAQRGVLKGLANKSKYKEKQNEIADVSVALRESTKHLCRNLQDNPNISGNLRKIEDERLALINLLERTCKELRERNSFNTLVQQVENDELETVRMEETKRRANETSAEVLRLHAELNSVKQEHEIEVKERREIIAKLKEELQQIKSRTKVSGTYARKEARAKTSSLLRQYHQEERSLSKQISILKKTQDMENQVHSETVQFLKAEAEQLTALSEHWENKYQ